jgi:Tfp pilus assembly pilus retraction ATPase PilT
MKKKRKAAEANDFATAFGGVSDEMLKEHIWVTGGSGSGKSAQILAPLVSQVNNADENSGPSRASDDEGAGG